MAHLTTTDLQTTDEIATPSRIPVWAKAELRNP
jgi:hypothetical protein